MNQITINRGSDLIFTGTWRDESGEAVDLTGWEIAVFEPNHLGGDMTVEWIDAAAGTYEARLEWNDSIPSGRVASFRLRISSGEQDRSSPLIIIGVQ